MTSRMITADQVKADVSYIPGIVIIENYVHPVITEGLSMTKIVCPNLQIFRRLREKYNNPESMVMVSIKLPALETGIRKENNDREALY